MKEKIKEIKKQFMAYRNGIVADTLRNAGIDCYNIIFGLNLPQLSAIAKSQTADMEIAQTLWADRKVRESRLLATFLFPKQDVDAELAIKIMEDVQTQEEADMLAFKLLQHLPFLNELKEGASGYMSKALSRF